MPVKIENQEGNLNMRKARGSKVEVMNGEMLEKAAAMKHKLNEGGLLVVKVEETVGEAGVGTEGKEG